MSFLISDAWAQQAPAAAPPGGGAMSWIFLIGMFAVMYLFLIRPQVKRQKEHKKMVEALSKGDEVVTNGGLLGKVTALGDNFIQIEVAEGTEVKVQRQAVAAVMPKGTLKSL